MPGFKDTIRHYKSQGYKIAIDDAGSCYSGLNLICDIVPHYLKLDISLIHNIHKDHVKYGDEKGDEIIQMLKNIIIENLSETETMAMLDEDTIVTILAKGRCRQIIETVTHMFRNKIREYYSEEDWEKGCIERTNKHGEKKKYALIDLSAERIL